MRVTGRRPPCLVSFHAHPDDEAIFTGGTIAAAVAGGWRVVLVVATSGEEGARPPWLAEDLAPVRRGETLSAARLLGIDRVEFLGYADSGADPVTGSPPVTPATGATPGDTRLPTLHAAPTAEVVDRLRRILIDEGASALTSYDRIGVYGHPDHRRVHEIAATAVVGTACDLAEATVSRPFLRRLRHDLLGRGLDPGSWPASLVDGIGTDHGTELIAFDVSAQQAQKRAAIAAHASQIVEAPTFMGLPPGAFHRLLDIEWFHPARRVDGRFTDFLHGRRPDTARTHDGHNSRLIQARGWSVT